MDKSIIATLKATTREELVRLAKKSYGLTLKPSETKETIIKEIMKSAKKATPIKKAEKAVVKKPVKTVSATKAAKPVVKIVAKKTEPKTEPKPEAKKQVEAKPAAAVTKPSQRKPQPAPAQRAKIYAEEQPSVVHISNGKQNVESSKFYVATTQEHMEASSIPDRYEDNRIILFVRDPHWIYAAWDMNPNKSGQTASKFGLNPSEFGLAIRVYDVTDLDFNGTNAHKFFDLGVGNLKGSYYINVPEDDRRYIVEIGLKNHRGDFYAMARSNMVWTPRFSASNRTDEEWMILDDDFWKMYALSGGFKVRGSSMEMGEMMKKHLGGETSSGITSFGGSMRAPEEKDSFWYRLNCELIVYGATEPNANVTMMGEKVNLRPDGTFTARFALPDGVQIIETKAVSANGKYEKTITPSTSKGTTAFQNWPSDNGDGQ